VVTSNAQLTGCVVVDVVETRGPHREFGRLGVIVLLFLLLLLVTFAVQLLGRESGEIVLRVCIGNWTSLYTDTSHPFSC